jgi:Beta-lactamase
MAKSVVGMLIGIAMSEGAIRSVDDKAETHVPEFRGTEYGKTPIRDLLHMSSGVYFGEESDNGRDLNRLWLDLMGGYRREYAGEAKGTIGSIVQFNRRIAPSGTRFFYASIEVDVLAMVLRYAVGKSASEYLQEKIWLPVGRGGQRLMAGGCARLRSRTRIFQCRLARLRAARTPARPRWRTGRQPDPIDAMDGRWDDSARLRCVPRPRKGGPHVRVWLSLVAFAMGQASVRAFRRLWPAHLYRSGLQTCYGPDIGRSKS